MTGLGVGNMGCSGWGCGVGLGGMGHSVLSWIGCSG